MAYKVHIGGKYLCLWLYSIYFACASNHANLLYAVVNRHVQNIFALNSHLS